MPGVVVVTEVAAEILSLIVAGSRTGLKFFSFFFLFFFFVFFSSGSRLVGAMGRFMSGGTGDCGQGGVQGTISGQRYLEMPKMMGDAGGGCDNVYFLLVTGTSTASG